MQMIASEAFEQIHTRMTIEGLNVDDIYNQISSSNDMMSEEEFLEVMDDYELPKKFINAAKKIMATVDNSGGGELSKKSFKKALDEAKRVKQIALRGVIKKFPDHI